VCVIQEIIKIRPLSYKVKLTYLIKTLLQPDWCKPALPTD